MSQQDSVDLGRSDRGQSQPGGWRRQGAALSGLGLRESRHPEATSRAFSLTRAVRRRRRMRAGRGQACTLCHLRRSGQLLGGRGHALGGPRKGPLWRPAPSAVTRGSWAQQPPTTSPEGTAPRFSRSQAGLEAHGAHVPKLGPFSRGGGFGASARGRFPRLTLAALGSVGRRH